MHGGHCTVTEENVNGSVGGLLARALDQKLLTQESNTDMMTIYTCHNSLSKTSDVGNGLRTRMQGAPDFLRVESSSTSALHLPLRP